ncbi:putative Ufm1-specific protease [Nymphaea thermarum]|nr:putative Ufm1-specific protease [Nymphaea thermarum]
MERTGDGRSLRILCPKLKAVLKEPGLQWLIGSPALPFTVVSSVRCLHTLQDGPFSPDYEAEADDLRSLLPRGFNVIGAIYLSDTNWEINARKAAAASAEISRILCRGDAISSTIGAAGDLNSKEMHYFIANSSDSMEPVVSLTFEENPENSLWEIGCLLRAEVEMKLPTYFSTTRPSDMEPILFPIVDGIIEQLRSPSVVYMVKASNDSCEAGYINVMRYSELDFSADGFHVKHLENANEGIRSERQLCSYFCSRRDSGSAFRLQEVTQPIQVKIFFNQSKNVVKPAAPVAEFFPADGPAGQVMLNVNLDILGYASKGLPVAAAVSKIVIPGLIDQLIVLRSKFVGDITSEPHQFYPYHFLPPGFLHPVTAIYELSYGETERKQVELRRQLHLRLGLPMDRPLLRVANALAFVVEADLFGDKKLRKDSNRLRDVHSGMPSSGVSGGLLSLVDGSYEYYHYLQDGINDNGWGCAYRSLQTIISWFKLQHYTSLNVPSHREIQQALVEIGDKELSFIGSSEWIGAIELSYVLDKLLGVTCKIINVRSGSELPEKCRELALHFETQGTPVMIGGGVLAYTLLGVDYNDQTGDCAFLILDPHYTGKDEIKSILNGGWCGWKKAVDSKGKHFFLHDKFYNLLLPQRPNMV